MDLNNYGCAITLCYSLFTTILIHTPASAGGPIVLMGIDAEDGGPGAHGPISVYTQILSRQIEIADPESSRSGILVIGGGKFSGDDVTKFWNEIGRELGVSIDFVHGEGAVAGLTDLSTYKLVAVASSNQEVRFGGLTDAENLALSRQSELITAFVNDHNGGLFSTSQTGLLNPYGYLGGLAAISSFFPSHGYNDISPRSAGRELGITDALDVCCWHDEYLRFPEFLQVLAVNAGSGKAAALGGVGVNIKHPDNCTVPRIVNVPIDNVPVWRDAPLCSCFQDDVSRALGCRINTPEFLFERWVPWPLYPGREFTIRYQMTAFTDIDGFTWNETLPDRFHVNHNHPTAIIFGPLAASQSSTTSLGIIAPAEFGEYEGQGILVAADGREHRSLNRYKVAAAEEKPIKTEPTRKGISLWWFVLTMGLVIMTWWLTSRHQHSTRNKC